MYATGTLKAGQTCGSHVASDLFALADARNVSCAWLCVQLSEPHCVNEGDLHLPAMHMMRHGSEWEGDCKQRVRGRYAENLAGAVVAVAGLFTGDWLPTLSKVVGTQGLVHGFEPTRSVSLARTTAAANGLANVVIHHKCLSDRDTSAQMCVRNKQGRSRGGSSAVIESSDAAGACGAAERVRCRPLDAVLPWSSRRIAFVLLDVEGHEVTALEGATGLLKRWRPVLALEQNVEGTRVFNSTLGPLGYRRTFTCSGLSVFRSQRLEFGSRDP